MFTYRNIIFLYLWIFNNFDFNKIVTVGPLDLWQLDVG